MSASRPVLYEGMFLFNAATIQSSVSAATEALNEIFSRAEAEIVAIYRWDERKLAYPIKGQKRGLYMLTYFKARGTQIPNIERDVNLSDQLLRCMILKAEHVGETELELAAENAKESRTAEALEGAGEGEGETTATETAAPEAAADETTGDETAATETAGDATPTTETATATEETPETEDRA